MHRVVVAVVLVVVSFLVVPSAKGFAQNSPTPISDCEDITQRGNYVLTNDLMLTASGIGYGEGGDCLVISSSHVSINLDGWTMYVVCPEFFCPPVFGPIGGTGIHIMRGADHVSISNGGVQGFVYGIVGEANYISATNLSLDAVVGISLNNVSHDAFTNIDYRGADERYHGRNGPLLSLTGGGYNTFTNVSGLFLGSDLAAPDGIDIVNSNHNLISGVNMDVTFGSCRGAAVLLTNSSSFNSIINSTLFVDCGSGIQIDDGSVHNTVQGNNVTIASTPPQLFAMLDQNPNCGSDVWIDNSFSNLFASGQISASPANCID